MKILAIIPARGGSKAIPKKNITNLNGKPLIKYTIEAAQNSTKLDKIFLSSDDKEIINIAKECGINSEYTRPEKLATDKASTTDVVLDAICWLETHENYIPDIVVLLQPTSPLRTADDIDGAVEQFVNSRKDCLVSVHEMIEHPYECVGNIDKDDWQYLVKQDKKKTRRQDYKDKFYYINGALYLVDIGFLQKGKTFIQDLNTSFYIMPHDRGIDIDEYSDLKKAEFLMKSHNNED